MYWIDAIYAYKARKMDFKKYMLINLFINKSNEKFKFFTKN